MPYHDLTKIAKELYKKLEEAEERYIMIQGKEEKITEIEMVKIEMGRPSSPRFKLVTETGTMLLLTPSQFLKKSYLVIKKGKKYRLIGS